MKNFLGFLIILASLWSCSFFVSLMPEGSFGNFKVWWYFPTYMTIFWVSLLGFAGGFVLMTTDKKK